MAKGKVAIESDKDWLRLRFTAQGKLYAFALGLPDTKVNFVSPVARSGRSRTRSVPGGFRSNLQ